MRRIVALLLVAAGLGCAQDGGWVESLERRHPALRRVPGHRLGDVRPYYWPAAGRLTLLLCRWPDDAVVPVSLPSDASESERASIEAALRAWERALPLRFERREAGPREPGIEIRLLDDMIAYEAGTVADCAVNASDPGRLALPARIVYASIHLARGDPRLAGSALHELGHALGFQGHVRRGHSVMVDSAKEVRRAGEQVLDGRAWQDAAVEALYAVPSGTVLRRDALPPGRTQAVDALLTLARQHGWRGPLLRAGDAEGRIAWRERDGRLVKLKLEALRASLAEPAKLVVTPGPAAKRWLAGER